MKQMIHDRQNRRADLMSVKLDCFEGRQNFSDEDNFNPFNKSQID
jgi:hypothetical protein